MTQVKMMSNIALKLINKQPIDLTPVFSGSGTGSAYLLRNKIVVTLAAAEHTEKVTIPTPIDFVVRDVRIRHDNSTASSIQVVNANVTDHITSAIAIAGVDKDIDRLVDIDNDHASFSRGDDDLVLLIETGLFTGVVEIIIEPTVS